MLEHQNSSAVKTLRAENMISFNLPWARAAGNIRFDPSSSGCNREWQRLQILVMYRENLLRASRCSSSCPNRCPRDMSAQEILGVGQRAGIFCAEFAHGADAIGRASGRCRTPAVDFTGSAHRARPARGSRSGVTWTSCRSRGRGRGSACLMERPVQRSRCAPAS